MMNVDEAMEKELPEARYNPESVAPAIILHLELSQMLGFGEKCYNPRMVNSFSYAYVEPRRVTTESKQ